MRSAVIESATPSSNRLSWPSEMPKVQRLTHEEVLLTDAQQRNIVTSIPFLPLSYYTSVVPLPVELYNEPYSFFDTKKRPEITVRRSRFLFEVGPSAVYMTVHGVNRSGATRQVPVANLPAKKRTNISVITVYDTYGLEITYAYLRFLYLYKYAAIAPEWLEYYLVASLAVLQPEALSEKVIAGTVGSEHSVLYYASRLMLELTNLDSKQPRMIGELVAPAPVPKGEEPPPVFPKEVLSKITGSERLSKSVAEATRSARCASIPTLDELAGGEDVDEATFYDNGVFVLYYSPEVDGRGMEAREWRLTREGNSFILRDIGPEDEPHELDLEAEVVQYPLYVYARVFKNRGCNTDNSILAMLRELVKRYSVVTEENVMEVAAWVVQLSYETREGEEGTFRSMTDLGNELQRLLGITIRQLQQ